MIIRTKHNEIFVCIPKCVIITYYERFKPDLSPPFRNDPLYTRVNQIDLIVRELKPTFIYKK